MKTLAKIVILLILSLYGISSYAQVTVCAYSDGVTPPVISGKKTAKMCKNDTVTLSLANCVIPANTNVTYHWRHLGLATDYWSQSVLAKDTGMWVGYIMDNLSTITYTDTIHLILHPVTSINSFTFSPNAPTYCPLDVVTVSLNTTGTFTTFQWYNRLSGTPVIINGETSSTLKFTDKPKQVMVIAGDANGCLDTLVSGFIGAIFAVPANLGSDQGPVCQGTSVSVINNSGGAMYGGGNVTYRYYRLDSISPLVFNPVLVCPFGPQTGGTYQPCSVPLPNAGKVKIYMTITQPFVLCPNADTIVVTVTPIPVVDLPADSVICYGQNMDIKGKVKVGKPNYNYTWTAVPAEAGFPSTTNNSTSSSNTIKATPTVNTEYKLSVTDANGCGTGVDSITLTANPALTTTIRNDTTICKYPLGGTAVNLWATASGGGGGLTYLWSPITSNYGLSSTTTLTTTATPNLGRYANSAIYKFEVTDINNCSDSKTITINLYAPPLNNIPDPIIVNETNPYTINMSTTGNAGFDFTWKNWVDTLTADTVYNIGTAPKGYIKGLGTSPSVYLEYAGPGAIFYEVTAQNNASPNDPNAPNACINRDTIKIQYISENTLLYVPNIFSPNALSTENQHLKIYGDNLAEEGFKFIVYNKWGNLMYESTDLMEVKTNGWDGGSKIEGVYTYVIVGKFKNGKDVTESPYNKGTFSLIK